ncbi:MAG TPA: RAD55 family ATPase, partial [Nitrospiraceae bacterium]
MTEPLKTQTLRTGLSAAYWCDPTTDYSFEAAHLPAMTRSAGAKQTSWFDELFEGGLRIPDRDAHTTMSLVVTGPPGTGKTTLCLELCYRLATASRDTDRLRSLYLTTEGHAPWLVQHAREFGWDTGKNILDESTDAPVCVRALKTEDDFADFRSELRSGTDSNSQSFGLLIDELHEGIFGTDSKTPLRRASPLQARSSLDLSTFDVVVFDNLNTLRIDKGLWFQTMVDLGNLGPRLVIVVADSTGTDEISELWEYLADVVIRMGRENRETGGYLIRTIEIVKSRYQISALGRHQVKIHKAYPSEGSAKDRWLRMRHHPFREEGGVFIYPSMHFVLSRHKYLYPLEPEETRGGIPPCFDELKMMLKGTFHPGRCVAFVGGHGTHKSRLAFIQVLFTLSQLPNASALIISLGEDEVS